MQENIMKFTTSWDDGCALDMRVADILTDAGCTGTFYVCPSQQQEPLLSDRDLRDLAAHHEIGAHSLTHPHLPSLPPPDARQEIAGSKQWIEERTGKTCAMFCYPFGEHTDVIRSLVHAAGFHGARTTSDFSFHTEDPYALGTSLHLYPYPLRPVWNRCCLTPFLHAWPNLTRLGIPMHVRCCWQSMARAVFFRAQKNREPWFHLWGHSWELERYHLWNELTAFLAFVRTFPNVHHVPNSSLLSHADSPAQ